jgi:hypothetical protein
VRIDMILWMAAIITTAVAGATWAAMWMRADT